MGILDDMFPGKAHYKPQTGVDTSNHGATQYGNQQEIDVLQVDEDKIVRDSDGRVVDRMDTYWTPSTDIEKGAAFWPPEANESNSDEKVEVQRAKSLKAKGITVTEFSV